jgi:uncharacterized protein YndB with AHSA1/START domain
MTDAAPSTTAEDLGPVRTEVRVAAAPEKAFRVFTDGFDSWWPGAHHIAEGELDAVFIEPRTGGRWGERLTDGTECAWGAVLAWDPPRAVTLEWRLGGDFELDEHHASRVDVTFTPTEDGGTHVVLEHSGFAGHRSASDLRTGVQGEGGWPALLGMFAQATAA